MNPIPITMLGTFAILLVGGHAPAQEPRAVRVVVSTKRPEPHFAVADDLIGAPVALVEKRDPANADGSSTAKPDQESERIVGEATDILVDARTGRPYLLGVEVGDDVRAIDAMHVRWNQDEKRWMVEMSQADFDSAKFAIDGDLTRLREATGRDAGSPAVVEASSLKSPGEPITVTQLAEVPVRGTEGEISSSSEVVVETTTGAVAFLAIDVGGLLGIGAHEIAVPFGAVELKVEQPEDGSEGEEPERRLELAAGKPALEVLPEMENTASLQDTSLRRKLYDAFGVARPLYEPATDSGKDR